VSDEADNHDAVLPGEVTSCPSSHGSLRMCFVNEAAFDDDDDDDDDNVGCGEIISGPMASPDLIAGIRRPAEQVRLTVFYCFINKKGKAKGLV